MGGNELAIEGTSSHIQSGWHIELYDKEGGNMVLLHADNSLELGPEYR